MRKLWTYFPDQGPLRRELYKKHTDFFALGAHHRERLFLAANRTGKSITGAYETSVHLSGLYPHWWVGKRFTRPNRWWVAGDTSKTVRDIVQEAILGPARAIGTGMLPGNTIIRCTPKSGIPDAVDTVHVRHISGGTSVLQFKSYDQGREAFQGTEQDGIWLDEECPMNIYAECLIRTMTTDGTLIVTFTPLLGLTELVLSFLPEGQPL